MVAKKTRDDAAKVTISATKTAAEEGTATSEEHN